MLCSFASVVLSVSDYNMTSQLQIVEKSVYRTQGYTVRNKLSSLAGSAWSQPL